MKILLEEIGKNQSQENILKIFHLHLEKVICEVPRSNAEDIDFALDAAHKAAPAWGKTGPAERANILLKIADRIEENTEKLALAETLDNGKPIREGFAADIPLTVDHFRYFAGAIRAQEGTIG